MTPIPFLRPSLPTLQQAALADITAANLTSTASPLRRSLLRILAYVVAKLCYGNYGYLDWIAKQSLPFTAEGEFLEAWAAIAGNGVFRKAATIAGQATVGVPAGSVATTGVAGAIIPQGSRLVRADGFTYVTTNNFTIPNPPNPSSIPTVSVTVLATEPGTNGNCSVGTVLSFSSPISGVNSAATIDNAIINGTDLEKDDSLRSRMLLSFAAPPQGGSLADYQEWCLEIPGVSQAWALGGGSGAGSVTVFTMFDDARSSFGGFPQGTDGAATLERRAKAAGINADGNHDQLDIANYLYTRRPGTALVLSAAPQPFLINISIKDMIPDTADLQAAVSAALVDTFKRIRDPRLSIVYPSDINAAIDSVPGLQDFTLVTPIDKLELPNGTIPILGDLTFTAGTVQIF